MNEESMWKVVRRMDEAADKADRAATTMEQAAQRIAFLLEDGYGGNGLRLLEALESGGQDTATNATPQDDLKGSEALHTPLVVLAAPSHRPDGIPAGVAPSDYPDEFFEEDN